MLPHQPWTWRKMVLLAVIDLLYDLEAQGAMLKLFFFPHFDHPQESNKHTCWWLYFPDVLCLCTYWFPKQKLFPFLIQTIEMRRTMRWCVWDVKCKTVSYVWICVCVIAWLPLLGQASVSFGWHCASGKVCFVAFWGTKLRFLMWESLTVYQSICFRVC